MLKAQRVRVGPRARTTPTGVAVFAEDYAIRHIAGDGNNIVVGSEFDRRGHFAAMEAPDLFVEDVRTLFKKLRASSTEALPLHS